MVFFSRRFGGGVGGGGGGGGFDVELLGSCFKVCFYFGFRGKNCICDLTKLKRKYLKYSHYLYHLSPL
jgi:hypothetical protein